MLGAFSQKFEAAYPYLLPQDTPKERVDILRRAFDRTMSDAAFGGAVERLGMKVKPLAGEEIGRVVLKANDMPAALVQRLKEAIAV